MRELQAMGNRESSARAGRGPRLAGRGFSARWSASSPGASCASSSRRSTRLPGNGRPPRELEMMLRIYFLQQWFNLSDPAAEDALYDSRSMRRFVGLDLSQSAAPDETGLRSAQGTARYTRCGRNRTMDCATRVRALRGEGDGARIHRR